MALSMHPSITVHVGDWLRTEIIEPYGLKVTEAAVHLKVSRQAMSALLNARSGLSADMALRLEKAFGVRADTLLRMQANYEMAQARSHQDEIKVDRIELRAA